MLADADGVGEHLDLPSRLSAPPWRAASRADGVGAAVVPRVGVLGPGVAEADHQPVGGQALLGVALGGGLALGGVALARPRRPRPRRPRPRLFALGGLLAEVGLLGHRGGDDGVLGVEVGGDAGGQLQVADADGVADLEGGDVDGDLVGDVGRLGRGWRGVWRMLVDGAVVGR